MILTIDIGNSYITIGGYDETKRVFVSDILSDPKRTKYQYMVEFRDILELNKIENEKVTGAIIGSVVPGLTDVIKDAVETLFDVVPQIVGPGIKSGLNIRIENPSELGADIVAGAVAAIETGDFPIVICNLGTATVMSVVNSSREFTGVIIAAGVGATLDAFSNNTALLPYVNITPPKSIIGKNSVQSIQSGLIHGTAAMIDGLIERIETELGEKTTVIATGKMCHKITEFCQRDIKVYDYLILDGLKAIYDKNKDQKK